MNGHRIGVLIIFGGLALIVLYAAVNNTPNANPAVPEFETEAQFGGLTMRGDLAVNEGTVLDTRVGLHFWAPGFNPRDYHDGNFRNVQVRYPKLAGSNLTAVMHRGWSGFSGAAPDKDWFYNPPEGAVL